MSGERGYARAEIAEFVPRKWDACGKSLITGDSGDGDVDRDPQSEFSPPDVRDREVETNPPV
jgi:hypothetical protein